MGGAPATNAAPDWATLTLRLECPRCGYDLRLLPQPRCPECGLEFAWDDVLRAAEQRVDCSLFEYQWRRRPLRAFFGTIGRSLFPWRLWRQVRLTDTPRVGPLLALALITLLLASACNLLIDVFGNWAFQRLQGRPVSLRWFILVFVSNRYASGLLLHRTLLVVVTAMLTWLALLLFRPTLVRYRVRWDQLLRVTVLALVGFAGWQILVRVAVFGYVMVWPYLRTPWDELLPLVSFVLSMALGLSVYLKLRHGWWLGVVTVSVLFLFLLTLTLGASVFVYDSYSNPVSDLIGWIWPGLTGFVVDLLLSQY
jgi:hypothetical protein